MNEDENTNQPAPAAPANPDEVTAEQVETEPTVEAPAEEVQEEAPAEPIEPAEVAETELGQPDTSA